MAIASASGCSESTVAIFPPLKTKSAFTERSELEQPLRSKRITKTQLMRDIIEYVAEYVPEYDVEYDLVGWERSLRLSGPSVPTDSHGLVREWLKFLPALAAIVPIRRRTSARTGNPGMHS